MSESEDFLEALDLSFIEIFTSVFSGKEIADGVAAFEYLDETGAASLG